MAKRDRDEQQELRSQLYAAQGIHCAAPGCREPWTDLAHIQGRGMGGVGSRDRLENVCGLCRHHHDVLDGRQMAGRQEFMRSLLREYTLQQRLKLGVADPPAGPRAQL